MVLKSWSKLVGVGVEGVEVAEALGVSVLRWPGRLHWCAGVWNWSLEISELQMTKG